MRRRIVSLMRRVTGSTLPLVVRARPRLPAPCSLPPTKMPHTL